jgi:hypothetical protein
MKTITINGMTAIGYFTTPPVTRKPYPRTEIDDRKDKADFLIQAVDGSRYTIYARAFTLPESRGVKRYQNGCYAVTDRVLDVLKAKYTHEYDF